MPSANYVLIEKITVGAAGASSVTFSNIPQTGYTDLVIKTSTRSTSSAGEKAVVLQFNGVTTGYSTMELYGNGSAAYAYSRAGIADGTYAGEQPSDYNTANVFNNGEIYIPNYTSSNYKSWSSDLVSENNATLAKANMSSGLWTNTAAITSIKIYPNHSESLKQYSTFYLYGVAKLGTTPAIVPYATGGDTIMTDGTYWYHTFLSSGTFTPAKALTCDYLVVAGGGGGGFNWAGGGGAGGLRSTVTATGGGGSLESALSLGTSAYTVTVGAGGAGGLASGTNPGAGSNSVFATITSTGGGRGGSGNDASYASTSGGSGGGGGRGSVTTGSAGTANQGYAGGNGDVSGLHAAGGGGAGAAGNNNQGSGRSGNGGTGVAVSITGSSVTYAGGGGGGGYTSTNYAGSGGAGGGGNGTDGVNGNGSAGTANLGAGGGGGSGGSPGGNGGNGGSGIVIVRYAV